MSLLPIQKNETVVLSNLINKNNIFKHIINNPIDTYEPANMVQIILTNGKTVNGLIDPMEFEENTLILYYNIHILFYIPFSIIAGFSFLSYDQIKIMQKESPKSNISIYEIILENLYNSAISMGIVKKSRYFMGAASLTASKPFKWGDMSFTNDVAVYSDWSYLERISGGVNSLGAGIGILSLSTGWSKSLWSLFKDKTKKKSVDIGEINGQSEVIINGYVSLIERYKEKNLLEKVVDKIEIEGCKWIPVAISDARPKNFLDLKNSTWCLAYFKEDGFMLPKEVWDKFSNKINIFGEVVHIETNTEIGTKLFFIKSRCAAYVNSNKK